MLNAHSSSAKKAKPLSKNDAKTEEMLARIVEIVRRQGLAAFSLDNLAPQLGTSSRMLVYYFGSKDELLGRVVYALRDDIVTQMENEPDGTITDAIDRWWGHYRANPIDMQFFFHLTSRSFEEPEKFREFSSTAVGKWEAYFCRSLESHAVSEEEAHALSRLVLGTLRGLSADLLLTSDERHVDQALDAFKELLATRLDPPAVRRR